MSTSPSLFSRPDTLLGVCEGLGEDFGFNPLYLRIGLAVMIFWSPVAAFSTYLALAAAVLVSRLVFPKPRAITRPIAPQAADNDHTAVNLAAAA